MLNFLVFIVYKIDAKNEKYQDLDRCYLSLYLTAFLYFLFSKFSIKEITYNFIKSNSEYLILGIKFIFSFNNFCYFGVLDFSFTRFWIYLGFSFGFSIWNRIRDIFCFSNFTLGSCLSYIIASFFFKDLVKDLLKDKLTNIFKFLQEKIKKNEFFIIFLLRIIGGTPIQFQNILPVLFNIKLKNFFFGSLLGFAPQVYIFSALGSGLEKQI